MPSDKAMQIANTICQPSYFGGTRNNDAQHVLDVANALDAHTTEAVKEAVAAERKKVERLREVLKQVRYLAADVAANERPESGQDTCDLIDAALQDEQQGEDK